MIRQNKGLLLYSTVGLALGFPFAVFNTDEKASTGSQPRKSSRGILVLLDIRALGIACAIRVVLGRIRTGYRQRGEK